MSTVWLMPEDLRKATVAATGQGLEFLKRNVEADGGWPSRVYKNWELSGSWRVEFSPFVAGLGLLALEECADPAAEELRARTRAFLHARIDYPGVWRYWPHLVPDLDSTAICSLAATPHLWLLLGRKVEAIEAIVSYRDGEGRFLTWMRAPDGPGAARNDVDCVVNANVIAYLGDRVETLAARRWLEALVREQRVTDTFLPYYPSVMDLYVALVRASCLAPPVFAGLRPTLASRILACRDAGGGFGDVLRTAQAVTALDRLGKGGREAVVRPALESILATQRPDGGWPECLAWKGIPGTSLGFGSEALTTACCIEAMVRVVRQ